MLPCIKGIRVVLTQTAVASPKPRLNSRIDAKHQGLLEKMPRVEPRTHDASKFGHTSHSSVEVSEDVACIIKARPCPQYHAYHFGPLAIPRNDPPADLWVLFPCMRRYDPWNNRSLGPQLGVKGSSQVFGLADGQPMAGQGLQKCLGIPIVAS